MCDQTTACSHEFIVVVAEVVTPIQIQVGKEFLEREDKFPMRLRIPKTGICKQCNATVEHGVTDLPKWKEILKSNAGVVER